MNNLFPSLPTETLAALEDELARFLQALVKRSEFPRALLSFVGEDGYLKLHPPLRTDSKWHILLASVDDGLIGQAIRQNEICFFWPDAEVSESFLRGDDRTIAEAAAPIKFKNEVIGVLLIDFFDGEALPDRALLRAKIIRWSSELSEILESIERQDDEIRAAILVLTGHCVRNTSSVRGYTALKKWDGTIVYFPAGLGVEKFLTLSQLEGICGEVFQKGEFLNVGKVREHPSYVPSDHQVESELVAPIIFDDEVIGVLNLESHEVLHYDSNLEIVARDYAAQLVGYAHRFRRPIGSGIGVHSRLLSDLIESFSAVSDEPFGELSTSAIERWAYRILCRKVQNLGIVQGAEVIGSANVVLHEADMEGAREEVCFPILIEGTVRGGLRVLFKEKPGRGIVEIVQQFCRLTANEVRRRASEAWLVEFERFLADLVTRDINAILPELPR